MNLFKRIESKAVRDLEERITKLQRISLRELKELCK